MSDGKGEVLFCRLPEGTNGRADALLPLVRSQHVGLRVTRSTVLRVALLRGLDEMEAESRASRAESPSSAVPVPTGAAAVDPAGAK